MEVVDYIINASKLDSYIDHIFDWNDFNEYFRLMMNQQTAKNIGAVHGLTINDKSNYYYMGIRVIVDNEISNGEVMILKPIC